METVIADYHDGAIWTGEGEHPAEHQVMIAIGVGDDIPINSGIGHAAARRFAGMIAHEAVGEVIDGGVVDGGEIPGLGFEQFGRDRHE